MSDPDFPSQFPPDNNLEDRVRNDASRVADTARRDMKDLGDELKQEAGEIAAEARGQVERVAETAKGFAEDQKMALADQLDGVASSLDKVAGDLEGKGESSAHYVRMVADGATKLTSAVRDNSVDGMIGMAEDFGRRQPAAFMGAAALLGFVASRFVVASASRRAEQAGGAGAGRAPGEPLSNTTPAPSTTPAYARATGGSDARN